MVTTPEEIAQGLTARFGYGVNQEFMRGSIASAIRDFAALQLEDAAAAMRAWGRLESVSASLAYSSAAQSLAERAAKLRAG